MGQSPIMSEPSQHSRNKYHGKQGCLHFKFLGILTLVDSPAPLAVFSTYSEPNNKAFYNVARLNNASVNFAKLGNDIQAIEFNEELNYLQK